MEIGRALNLQSQLSNLCLMPHRNVIPLAFLHAQRDAHQLGAHGVGGGGLHVEGDKRSRVKRLHQRVQRRRILHDGGLRRAFDNRRRRNLRAKQSHLASDLRCLTTDHC